MGYEEVETVLPDDYFARPDPVPEPAPSSAVVLEQSQNMDDALESVSSYRKGKKKKKKNSSNRNASSNSIVGRWRQSRKSRSRKRRMQLETASTSACVTDEECSKSCNAQANTKSKSRSKSRSWFPSIKQVDSNVTVVASNTTKSKELRMYDVTSEAHEATASVSLPTVDENRNPRDSSTDSIEQDRMQPDEGYPIANNHSVKEVGDEMSQFSLQPLKIPTFVSRHSDESSNRTHTSESFFSIMSRSIKNVGSYGGTNEKIMSVSSSARAPSPASRAPSPSAVPSLSSAYAIPRILSWGSVRSSSRSMKSSKVKSESTTGENISALVVQESVQESVQEESVQEESVQEESIQESDPVQESVEESVNGPKEIDTSSEPLVIDSSKHVKWTKKVAISIGGYKTSFSVSDPMTTFAEAVKDALDVVNDDNLCQQAKELDNIHAPDDDEENERDYDHNPTRLFMFIQQRAWSSALVQMQHHPNEATVWVFRKANDESTQNVLALANQDNALVVHNESETVKYRWRLLPLHAAIVLGAPSEFIQDIIRVYPNAAKHTDERGSLPVHLAASRLDVDPDGEKIVLQLFGVYPDSIDVQDRKGRTPVELAKLARARKEIEEQRRIKSTPCSNEPTDGGQLQHTPIDVAEDSKCEVEDGDDDIRSVNSGFSGRFRQMLRKSKSTDTAFRQRKKKQNKEDKTGGNFNDLSVVKSMDRDDQVADDASIAESLGPGFAFLTTSKSQEARELPEVNDRETEQTEEEQLVAAKRAFISMEYQLPELAPASSFSPMNIPLPHSFSLDDYLSPVLMERKKSFLPSNFQAATEELNTDHLAAETLYGPNDDNESNNEGLLVLLEKAAENAGRRGMDVSEFLEVLEDEWVTDVEALRRLDGRTLDDLLPIMLSRELQRLIHHADSIDDMFLQDDEGSVRSPNVKRNKKKGSTRSHHRRVLTTQDSSLAPICEKGESPTAFRDEYEANKDKEDDFEISRKHANLIAEARKSFPTRTALEDCIQFRRAEVEAAVNSSFDVSKETLARAALADDEVRKLLPLRLILPSLADLEEMVNVLKSNKLEVMQKDSKNIVKLEAIDAEIDELTKQIELEQMYVGPRSILKNTIKTRRNEHDVILDTHEKDTRESE
jgi:flavodoxin